jgi:hypothetical protein
MAKANINGFFGNMNHEQLIVFLAHHGAAKYITRYIRYFIKAGGYDNG